ncbi:hypothetical protein, partial [Eubacterium callanderi]|uniref:hypothetical protein n=1 Tax=Eubacterium callanderi TaxID=53442 RepID=UPI00210BC43A
FFGCSAKEMASEEIPLSERSIKEQIQNGRSDIFKEYDNIKAFRAVYQNDLRTMNGLVEILRAAERPAYRGHYRVVCAAKQR